MEVLRMTLPAPLPFLPWKNKQEEEVIHNSGEIHTCGVASTSALCGLAPIVYGVGDAML